ncbi:MAG TPA: PP2C family protein-serine/threonine phosphatase [Thermoanaerobaculia bacterium]|nr:PP2C family protein-serine/threonine phosphatase [Thermoanaerobaculia bacterium]
MKEPSIDDLVLLPEALALQRQFDAKNLRRFRWLLASVTLFALAGLGTAAANQVSTLRVVFYAANLVVILALVAVYRERFFERHFRQLLIAYLFVQMALPGFWTLHWDQDSAAYLGAFFPVILLVFRLRLLEHLVLYGTFWAAEVVRYGLSPAGKTSNDQATAIAATAGAAACFILAAVLTQLDKRRFLAVWRREHTRSRERLRMREEIETARKIQLSMLPQGAPDLGWLEFSAVSLPATEVGGDYYDYFRLGPSRLALVIGDVAGHGLASGLLLSGVRSCLYLMEDDLAAPAEVFRRLNRMVRRTTERRTYVTLLLAIIDREAGILTLTSAGHPPLLHYSAADGSWVEVGRGAPPLGTFLATTYEQEQRPISPDDLLVVYTDGLSESHNARGEEYGEERLMRAIRRAADGRPVREIRDSVLSDLSNFKGNEEQADDITLVITRLR